MAFRLGVNTLFYIPGEVGGSETYLLETLHALERLPDPPDLTLFSNRENDLRLRGEFPAATVIPCKVRARSRFARILMEQIALPGSVQRGGVEVLWSPGYTVPVGARCPQVVTILDMQYKRFPEDVTWLAARTMDVLYPLSARRSRAIVTISEYAKQEIVRFLRLPEGKITVTPLAVDPDFGRPGQPALPEGLAELPYLLCVAHTYPHKHVATLVRAFNRIAGEVAHRLVLVGQPRLGEAAVAEAVQESLPGRVLRLAGLDRRSLIALYQAADWFVLPSLYEGFGLPALEAMAAGVPVLMSRAASLPEIGGEAVCYVEDRDAAAWAGALRAAIAMPLPARQRLIAAARLRAAQFTWQESAERLWEVMRQVRQTRRGW